MKAADESNTSAQSTRTVRHSSTTVVGGTLSRSADYSEF